MGARRKRGNAIRRETPDLLESGVFLIAPLVMMQQQRGMPLHNGEDVVEVMRNSGGKLADRFHLLGTAELHFQVQTFGNIFGIAMHGARGVDPIKRP